MKDEKILEVKNLSKKFIKQDGSEFWALKDISFELTKGESLGVIGHNGVGKSTLLKILSGIMKPTAGSAVINGRVASVLDIGAGLHPELTGKENIYVKGALIGMKTKHVESVYEDIVEFSGINDFIDEPVKNYSNGMFLRLAFSIIFHFEYDIYLLDEVLGAGDIKFREKCNLKIRELQQNGGTILIVSHDLERIVNNVSKLMLLEKGNIGFIGQKELAVIKYTLGRKKNIPISINYEQIETKVDGKISPDKILKLEINKSESFTVEHTLLNRGFEDIILMCSILTIDGKYLLSDSSGFKQNKPYYLKPNISYHIKCEFPLNLFNRGNFLINFNVISTDINKESLDEPFFIIDLKVLNNSKKYSELTSLHNAPLQSCLNWSATEAVNQTQA